jgi:WD40 repeat protein
MQEGSTIVVIALRADFYAACAPYENLRKFLSQNQEYIGPMNASELRRAIEEPARANGWLFEPSLTDLLLQDIGADGDRSPEPGALPLLSHALLETWHRRSGRMLTLAGYAESGKIHEAITRTAEAVFAQFSIEEQSIARNIFLRLTELGEGTQETRRRVLLSEIIPPPESTSSQNKTTETVLKMLSDARLIITTEETAEVAHEALIREWDRLHEWLTENREGLRLHRHITESAREWERQERDKELVYRGMRLAQALEWADSHLNDLNLLEREFLETSNALAKQETAEREAQRQRELEAAHRLAESERQRAEQQTRTTQQLRTRAIYVSAAFIAAVILAIIAFFLEQKAVRETEIARSNELAAASISNLKVDPELSILLALQAVITSNTTGAEDALHRAVQASRIKYTLTGHTDEVNDIEFSPDGTKLASASLDRTAKVWDTASGKELFTLKGHGDQVLQIRFSPNGKSLATASRDGTAKIWDVATGQTLMTLSGHTGGLTDIKYSPDGKLVATIADDHMVKIWNAESGRELLTLTDTSLFVISFSPNGSRIALGYEDGTIRVWDIITKQAILTLPGGHDGPVYLVSFSPDGNKLVSNDYDNSSIAVWDIKSGEQLAALSGYFPAFDPNGTLLATWTNVGDLAVYDTSNYQKVYTFVGHTAGGNGTIFNQNGSLLATPNADGTVKIWDMKNGRELFTLSGHAGGVDDAAFSPGCVSPPESPFAQCGRYLATASRDKTIKIWDVTPAGNREIITIPGYISFFNPIDKHLITGTFNDDLTTITYHNWDVTTIGKEREASSFSVSHPALIYDGGNSPDTTLAGTVSVDGTAEVLNLTTGEVALTFKPPEPIESVVDISILASGTRLTTISQNKELIVWDATSGKKIATLPEFLDPWYRISFSSAGSEMIVVSDFSSTATLWNLATGEKLFDLTGHTQPLYNSAFSPDGKRLVTVGKDGTAIVWDVQTGKFLFTLPGHSASIEVAVFSMDGTQLATGCVDGAVKVWDVSAGPTTGQELLNLTGYSPYIFTVEFSPDGRTLASSSFADGTTRVYTLRIEDLMAIARSRLTRSFTLEECQKYLHQATCP